MMRALAAALFLVALAVVNTFAAPLTLDLQPRVDLAGAWLALGVLLLAIGLLLKRMSVQVLASLILWSEIAANLSTQIVPFGTPLGSIWSPRVLLLSLALVAWLLLMQPARWFLRGLIAFIISTALVSGTFWFNVPRVAVSASLTWLAVDSHGALYATEIDNGAVWRFERDGTRSILFPTRAITNQANWQPASLGIELPPVTNTQIINTTSLRQPLLFCGLSIDPDDQLYIVDPNRHEVRQFAPDGQPRATWSLPSSYSLTQGCIAATRERVYVADATGFIHVFDHAGNMQIQWRQTQTVRGLACDAHGQLFVLHDRSIVALGKDGSVTREWQLPAPTEGLSAPYQSLLVRRNGEFLVTDINRGQVRRFDANGRELPTLGKAATWPGQFAGAGGLPGEIVEPLGLAEDESGNVYVSDTGFRLVQRFGADGVVRVVIVVPEDESNEQQKEPCVNGTC